MEEGGIIDKDLVTNYLFSNVQSTIEHHSDDFLPCCEQLCVWIKRRKESRKIDELRSTPSLVWSVATLLFGNLHRLNSDKKLMMIRILLEDEAEW